MQSLVCLNRTPVHSGDLDRWRKRKEKKKKARDAIQRKKKRFKAILYSFNKLYFFLIIYWLHVLQAWVIFFNDFYALPRFEVQTRQIPIISHHSLSYQPRWLPEPSSLCISIPAAGCQTVRVLKWFFTIWFLHDVTAICEISQCLPTWVTCVVSANWQSARGCALRFNIRARAKRCSCQGM